MSIPPVMVAMLREHLRKFGAAKDGRLFRASRGGHVLSKEYGEIWQAARRAVLEEWEVATPLAEYPSLLRAADVSLWLASGVARAKVARRAGHSIAVLFRFYARVIHGSQSSTNAQIGRAPNAANDQVEGPKSGLSLEHKWTTSVGQR